MRGRGGGGGIEVGERVYFRGFYIIVASPKAHSTYCFAFSEGSARTTKRSAAAADAALNSGTSRRLGSFRKRLYMRKQVADAIAPWKREGRWIGPAAGFAAKASVSASSIAKVPEPARLATLPFRKNAFAPTAPTKALYK